MIMENLIETIQKNLGYQSLNKIDPNTQEVTEENKTFGSYSLAQAAIPAVLIGVYDFLEKKEGYNTIKEGGNINWMDILFGNKKVEFNKKIAGYASVSPESAAQENEHIANEAVRLVQKWIKEGKDFQQTNEMAKSQKQETLHYLPAALQIGYLLGNNNIDDRTNKMEGPISNFMHAIEKQFNQSGEE